MCRWSRRRTRRSTIRPPCARSGACSARTRRRAAQDEQCGSFGCVRREQRGRHEDRNSAPTTARRAEVRARDAEPRSEATIAADSDAWPLACPVCGAHLHRTLRVFTCPAGHSFDAAREGYVNLLTPQHRERGITGDTPEMLHARRRFLEGGFYRPMLDRVIADAALLLRSGRTAQENPLRSIVEVGCGEGYYIGGAAEALQSHGAAEALQSHGAAARFVGLDVSKPAVRLAAKRYPDIAFAVANVRRRLYLHSASVDVLLSIFAPRNPAEFARVVAPGGHLIVVIPAQSHLGSLRSQLGLIGVEEAKEERVIDQFRNSFTLVDRSRVEYPLELAADAVNDLVMMGPNRWHQPAGGGQPDAGERTGEVETTASFVLLRLARSA
ncbi:MAG TPA: methyltransferase domain-containing protein [Longimicrobiales bacterium]|nr:methyltransferase domain-containing protein [Longimicrobiales bacterium]